MIEISGKVAVFSDIHFGVKGNSPLRHKICVSVVRHILKYCVENSVKNIIFGGDLFHQRNQISVDTLNVAYKCIQALSKVCTVYLILGNHDLFEKNSVDVNSVNIFKDNSNVKVIDSPEEIVINSKKVLLVPWLSDLSKYSPESFDAMIGHFEVSSKYLISSYVEEHSNSSVKTTYSTSVKLNDDILGSSNDTTSSGKLVGGFVDLVKRGGKLFAGHIHQHKEFVVKGRKFIFIGSPYQQNLGDLNYTTGFYMIDSDFSDHFIEISDIPKHIQLKCSSIIETGIDKFDFSVVRGNIIQKVYDIDVSSADDAKISQKISDFKPFEELLPDYQVKLDISSTSDENASLDQIQKSKLEYMKNYIDNIDDNALKADNLDREKLFSMLAEYYHKAVGDE